MARLILLVACTLAVTAVVSSLPTAHRDDDLRDLRRELRRERLKQMVQQAYQAELAAINTVQTSGDVDVANPNEQPVTSSEPVAKRNSFAGSVSGSNSRPTGGAGSNFGNGEFNTRLGDAISRIIQDSLQIPIQVLKSVGNLTTNLFSNYGGKRPVTSSHGPSSSSGSSAGASASAGSSGVSAGVDF